MLFELPENLGQPHILQYSTVVILYCAVVAVQQCERHRDSQDKLDHGHRSDRPD